MPLTPEQRAASDADFARLEAVLAEANALLRALAIGACPVPLDLMDSPDALTGGVYVRIVWNLPQYPPPDDPI